MFTQWFKRLYWWWYWRGKNRNLARAESYRQAMRQMLLEDLNSVSFTKVVK